MANHPSAEKRNRQNRNRRSRNMAVRSQMRRRLREARAAIEESGEGSAETVKQAIQTVYRAASKNAIKAETARRYVSRLMRRESGSASA